METGFWAHFVAALIDSNHFHLWTNGNVTPSLLVSSLRLHASTCPPSESRISYGPSLPGNASYPALSSTMLLVQLAMRIRYRTWDYMAPMFSGLILEAVGYAGRIQFRHNRPQLTPFSEYVFPAQSNLRTDIIGY